MLTPAAVQATARSGADSVFSYIERTAEVVPEGVRWQTLDDAGAPQYRGDLYSNGGIPLFLADYYRLTGNERALELGIASARWCSAPERRFLNDRPERESLGLIGGRAGIGLAWLRLAEATGDAGLLARAAQAGARLIDHEPGPLTDFGGGAAGHGILLLRLWQQTRDERHLNAAVRRAQWLAGCAIANERVHGAGWAINLALAEWIIRRPPSPPARTARPARATGYDQEPGAFVPAAVATP